MIRKLRSVLYRYKRVWQVLHYIRRTFLNWDEIIKRSLSGKQVQMLIDHHGLKIKGVDSNMLTIYKEIFEDKVYNPPGFELAIGSTVVDVGANIGLFSIFASLTPGVRIFAFEPHPENFQVLHENASSRAGDIRCFEAAIADSAGERILYEGMIPGGHKMESVNLSGTPLNKALRIKTQTLNDLMTIEGIDHIDFLKIDCEGAEGEILAAASLEDLSKINKIAMEFHDNASSLNHSQIMEKLIGAGFEARLSWDGKSSFGYIYANR
jgi:FkbM family methyltransferase